MMKRWTRKKKEKPQTIYNQKWQQPKRKTKKRATTTIIVQKGEIKENPMRQFVVNDTNDKICLNIISTIKAIQ